MRKLIRMPNDNKGSMLIAIDVPIDHLDAEVLQDVGLIDEIKNSINWITEPEEVDYNYSDISEFIVGYSKPIIESFKLLKAGTIPLQKATAEFGINFTGKGNVYLVEVSANAAIKVTLEWALSEKTNEIKDSK